MRAKLLRLFFVISILLAGCWRSQPSATPVAPQKTLSPLTASATPTTVPSPPTATPTAAPSPTSTATLTPTKTPLPSPTPTPTPGPDLAFLYIQEGQVFRYDLHTWQSSPILLTANGEIDNAILSHDQKTLIYADAEGVKMVDALLQSSPVIYPFNGENRGPMQLSDNDQLLAYSDDEGLKIVDLMAQKSHLFLPHYRHPEDETDIKIYSPWQWSPDKKWMLVLVGRWEGAWTRLVNVKTKAVSDPIGCLSHIQWLSGSQEFLMAVQTSGYNCCGDPNGVFRVAVVQGIFNEKLIEDTSALAIGDLGAKFMHVDPTETWAIFVHDEASEDLQHFFSSLKLLNIKNNQLFTLASKQAGQIVSPLWSSDGEIIYYVEQEEEQSKIYRLDFKTLEKSLLYSQADTQCLISISPDGGWLAFGSPLYSPDCREFSNFSAKEIHLLNLKNNQALLVASDPEIHVIDWQSVK